MSCNTFPWSMSGVDERVERPSLAAGVGRGRGRRGRRAVALRDPFVSADACGHDGFDGCIVHGSNGVICTSTTTWRLVIPTGTGTTQSPNVAGLPLQRVIVTRCGGACRLGLDRLERLVGRLLGVRERLELGQPPGLTRRPYRSIPPRSPRRPPSCSCLHAQPRIAGRVRVARADAYRPRGLLVLRNRLSRAAATRWARALPAAPDACGKGRELVELSCLSFCEGRRLELCPGAIESARWGGERYGGAALFREAGRSRRDEVRVAPRRPGRALRSRTVAAANCVAAFATARLAGSTGWAALLPAPPSGGWASRECFSVSTVACKSVGSGGIVSKVGIGAPPPSSSGTFGAPRKETSTFGTLWRCRLFALGSSPSPRCGSRTPAPPRPAIGRFRLGCQRRGVGKRSTRTRVDADDEVVVATEPSQFTRREAAAAVACVGGIGERRRPARGV